MTTIRMKLTGQLITDEKPVVLMVSKNPLVINKTAREYLSVFPDIFLNTEWGYFKPIVSTEQKQALGNLFSILNSPVQNVFSSLTHK